MVSDHADRHICIRPRPVLYPGKSADVGAQSLDRVDIEHGIHILDDTRKTFQPHTGINILLLQLRIVIVAVVIELGEHIVPDLHITVAFTAYRTVRTAAAIFLTAVIIYLRTRSAGTRAVLPEIILLAELKYPLRRDPDLLIPDLPCLVIFQIDGRIEPVRVKPDHLCQEFPGPVDRFSLEIISEREVPKHLKKSTVACRLPDILNIPGTDTLLTGRHPSPWRNLLSGKIRLQRRHA